MGEYSTHEKKNRVAHVCTSDLAVKFLILGQLRRLVESGYEVYAVSNAGDFEEELSGESFQYVPIPIKRELDPRADLLTLRRLSHYFRKMHFDAVHTHTNKAGILGCWAARLAGVEHILSTVHGFYFHEHMHPVPRAFYVNLYRTTFRLVKKVFMQSKEDLETAIRLHIIPEEKLVHIGNGIDLSRFDPSNAQTVKERKKLRELHRIPEAASLVGTVARINQEKGINELILAAGNLIKNRFRNVYLVVIGDGAARGECERLAASMGVSERVRFTGFVENIPAWLSAIDVFALPSHREGFPRTLCEAFAMGTPIVTTRIRGCRELVKDGETGLLVEPRDVSALIEAIDRLLGDRTLREAFAEASSRFARLHLDERSVIERIHRTYLELGLRPICATEETPESFAANARHKREAITALQ